MEILPTALKQYFNNIECTLTHGSFGDVSFEHILDANGRIVYIKSTLGCFSRWEYREDNIVLYENNTASEEVFYF